MDNDVVKRTAYDKLVTKSNAIIPSTSELVTKTQYHSDKQGLEKKIESVDKKIPNTSWLVKKTDYNAKLQRLNKNKIPRFTGLVTTATLNTKATEIGNKIPHINNLPTKATVNTKARNLKKKIPVTSTLVRETCYNNKITKNEDKIHSVSDFDTKLKSINTKVNKTSTY